MKKVKLDKLSLKKWAVARLQPDELKYIKGGYGTAVGATCGTASTTDGNSCACATRSKAANATCATDYCPC